MQWRGHAIGVDSPMPAKLAQHHWSPRVGDRYSAWKHVPAGEAFDGNVQTALGRYLLFLHWRNAIQNGYLRRVDPHTDKVRAMTPKELRQDLNAWGSIEAILSWRDRFGQAPILHAEGVRWAAEHGIVIAQEVKGPEWARHEWAFTQLYANCKAAGHPAWVKRIVTLRFPRATVVLAHRAHVKIAAIYGKGLRGRARRIRATLRRQRKWHGVRFDATW